MIKQKTVSFYTFGCRLNQSETAVFRRTFEGSQFKTVDIDDPADVVIINTCTVTENGDADTRRLIRKVNRLNPRAKIALVGCQAQIQKGKLAKWPNVRWVVGNAAKFDVKSIIESDWDPREPKIITPTIPRDSFTIPMAGIDRSHTRANLKIQDGCDFFCSFCEIPYARGRARSRQFSDILLEANVLAEAGYKELVLTGINLGTYKNDNKTLFDVISALEEIPKIVRVRISSIEPTTVSRKIIQKMAENSKLCRHLHIPLQSTDNRILKSMNRKYSFEEFKHFIEQVDQSVQNVCIGTDLIVGFPGESDQMFSETLQKIKESPIDYIHVFSYSNRQYAKSRHLGDQTPDVVIQSRSQRLRSLSQRKRKLFYQSLIGTNHHVLFEQKKNGWWQGLTDNYVRVVAQSHKNLPNQICLVRFDALQDQNIAGCILLE